MHMKKIILYLEDDASLKRHTTSLLEAENYVVEGFNRIDQIKEYFKNNKDSIKCIITDLNMDDEWLEEYQTESDGGMLSGWVWLQRFVFTYNPNIPTIIYSGYISYLKDYLKEKNQMDLLAKDTIRCVEKDVGEKDGFEGLKKTLKELIK